MNTPYFDFDSLPDDLFLKILEYLSFKEQVRLIQVNSRFNQMSRTAIAHQKELIIDENLMQYVMNNPLLGECSPIVERLVIKNSGCKALLLLTIFQYQFPRLVEIIIDAMPPEDYLWANFQQSCIDFIGRCPALKSVVFPVNGLRIPFRFPENMTAPNLENLVASDFDDESFRSASVAVPNLKNIKLIGSLVNISNEGFDQFCAAMPNLERISLSFCYGDLNLKGFIHFWRLPLKSLELPYLRDVDDQLLNQILASFPNLESIALGFSLITDVGLHALFQRSSPSLRSIEIETSGLYFENANFVIGCVDLEILRLKGYWLAVDVFIKIIRLCSQLKIISVYDIIGLDSEESIINFLPSFADMNRRRLQISIRWAWGQWSNETVKAALRELKENGGADIEITYNN